MSNEQNELMNTPTEDVNANAATDETVTNESETPEAGTEIEGTEGEAAEQKLSPEAQKAAGRAIKAERERMRLQYEQRLQQERQRIAQELQQQQAQQAAPSGSVYDPATGEYVEANSVAGQLIVRQMKIAERQALERAQNEYNDLSTKAVAGYERFDNYADTHRTFVNFGTDFMAEALKGVDDPAAVINYLGEHPEELKRIAQLPPARQAREIVQADLRLNPPKKLVSNAKPPINSINESNNPVSRAEEQSFEQREAYYRRLNNME